ncbi:hypothetical protein F5X68DRAFT_218915, partial [Plectosphaerella plurivora]
IYVGTYTLVSMIIGWIGEVIRVDDFKRGARAVVEAMEATLDKLLGGMWEATRWWLDLRRVSDTIVRAGAGVSFVSNPKNDWLKAGPGRVARADGEVLLVTDRDKVKATRESSRKVAWFLPEAVGKIVVVYVAWTGGEKPKDEALEFIWRDPGGRATGVALGLARYRAAEALLGDGEGDEEDDYVEVDPLTGEAVTYGTKIAWYYPGRLPPEIFLRSGVDDKGKLTVGTSCKPGRLSNSALIRAELLNPGSLEVGLLVDSTARDEAIKGSPPLLVMRAELSNLAILGPWTFPTGLEVLLGAGAGWRRLRGDLLAIVSVLFILLSVLRKGGSSIVVVPFVALMDDLVTRAREMDVEYIWYRSSISYGRDGLPRAVRLVFTAGLLEWIFVDEYYTVITDVGYCLRRFTVLVGWFREAILAGDAVVYTVERVKPGLGVVEVRVVVGDEKGVAEEEWVREDVRVCWWIAATSGLGTGIDVGGVVATGRGGRRAGEVVWSVGFIEETNERAVYVYVEATGAFADGVNGAEVYNNYKGGGIRGAVTYGKEEGERLDETAERYLEVRFGLLVYYFRKDEEVFLSIRIRELVEGLGAEIETTEAYLKWLGQDRRFYGLRGINLLTV